MAGFKSLFSTGFQLVDKQRIQLPVEFDVLRIGKSAYSPGYFDATLLTDANMNMQYYTLHIVNQFGLINGDWQFFGVAENTIFERDGTTVTAPYFLFISDDEDAG